MKKIMALFATISVVIITIGYAIANPTMTTLDADVWMLQSINDLRLEKGLQVMEGDEDLLKLAQIRAGEVMESFSHTKPDGSNSCEWILAVDEKAVMAGENLAYSTVFSDKYAQQMFKALCDSPSHYDNFVYPHFTRVAVYTLQGDERTVTVILFAG